MFKPSAFVASATAAATRRVILASSHASSSPTAQILGRCAVGTTSVWPSTAGTSGWKTNTESVRKISRARTLPTAIAQNGQGSGLEQAATSRHAESADILPSGNSTEFRASNG